MTTTTVTTENNGNRSEVFLKLAKTVGQEIPAERLVEYKRRTNPTSNPRYWAIVDFKQHSKNKRLYLFDTQEEETVPYLVAHGEGSDPDHNGIADHFSNDDGSHMSSLGIYKCGKSHNSEKHGLSLILQGLEATNSNAEEREIILHKADYVSQSFIDETGKIGRSYGCFVVENGAIETLVTELKNGSYLIAWDGK